MILKCEFRLCGGEKYGVGCVLIASRFEGQDTQRDQGPSDPISGVVAAAHSTIGGMVMGIVDYPVEINKMQSDHEVSKTLAKDFALDSGKGISRIIGTGLRAPMDFTMNVSKGFGNVPKLYGDDTVRKEEKVTGIDSGLGAAVKVCCTILAHQLSLTLHDRVLGLDSTMASQAFSLNQLRVLKRVVSADF